MSHLTQKDFAEVKAKLIEEKETLEKELGGIAKKNPHNSDDYNAQFEEYGNDESENASEVAEYGFNLSLEKTLEKSLKDVKAAIKRIEKSPEKFGICKYCQQPIDKKRLLARPTSSACITCKTKLKAL